MEQTAHLSQSKVDNLLQLAELLTVEEVAAYLRVAPNTVYRWCRSGRLTGIKIGKEWRISRQHLDQFLADRVSAVPQRSVDSMLVEELRPPEHIMVMSDDPVGIYDFQIRFLKSGLEAGHRLFIGLWWQDRETFRQRFDAVGLYFEDLVASDRLAIGDLAEAYRKGGPRGVIDIWVNEALATNGQILWGTGSHRLSDWQNNQDALIVFETELHRSFQDLPVVALCPCVLDHVDQPGFETLMRLMPHHSSALFPGPASPILMKVT